MDIVEKHVGATKLCPIFCYLDGIWSDFRSLDIDNTTLIATQIINYQLI
jgi:hypothetical protein